VIPSRRILLTMGVFFLASDCAQVRASWRLSQSVGASRKMP
jgi:hypothetical protein